MLIHGYIRKLLETLNINIPDELIELFVVWYHNPLYFIKISDGQTLNEDQTIIKNHFDAESAWTSILMSSMDNMVYEYTVKVSSDVGVVAIGIDENGYKRLNSWFVQQTDSIHYAFEGWNGNKDSKHDGKEPYGKALSDQPGRIIKMIYNVGKTSLSFIVDGEDYGIAFDNIESREDLNYPLAVYMAGAGTVELLGVSIAHAP